MPRITRVEVYTLSFPVEIRLSTGPVTETKHLIVRVHTDSGITGVGGGTPYLMNIYNSYSLCKKIAGKLREMDLLEAKNMLPQMQSRLIEKAFFDYGPFLALEAAVLDATSKMKEVSFSDLLGGKFRHRVPVSGTVFLSSPENMAAVAQKWVSKGISHLKIKVTGKAAQDADNLKHIRDVIGYDALIRIDANQAYGTVDKAAAALKKLEKYDVAIVEQPLKVDDLEGSKKLRKLVRPKIMLDESLRRPSDVELIAERQAADIINFHPSKLGCLTTTREALEKTLHLGLEYMIGSAVMTGLGVAEHLHLAASMERLPYPNEEIGLSELFGRDIVKRPFEVAHGAMEVPEDFGIGVSLDQNKMQKYVFNLNSVGMLFKRFVHRMSPKAKSPMRRIARKALSPGRK